MLHRDLKECTNMKNLQGIIRGKKGNCKTIHTKLSSSCVLKPTKICVQMHKKRPGMIYAKLLRVVVLRRGGQMGEGLSQFPIPTRFCLWLLPYWKVLGSAQPIEVLGLYSSPRNTTRVQPSTNERKEITGGFLGRNWFLGDVPHNQDHLSSLVSL